MAVFDFNLNNLYSAKLMLESFKAPIFQEGVVQ